MKPINQPSTYLYSKFNSYMWTAFMMGILGWSIPHLLKFAQAKDIESCLLIAAFDIAFVIMLVTVVIKYTIPALQSRVALELNEKELVSYTRNVTIPWKDIKGIDLRTGKSSSWLYITFKEDTDYGSYIRISLQFVKGNDGDIYDAIKAYKQ